jgi:hypothetical protein
MQDLWQGIPEPMGLRLAVGRDEVRVGPVTSGSQEGDIVTALDEPVGQLGQHELDAAVTLRGDLEERWCHDGYPQRRYMVHGRLFSRPS